MATNSAINSVSLLTGPALAVALIAKVGVQICFLINAATYLVVIGALLALQASELAARPLLDRAKGKLREASPTFGPARRWPDRCSSWRSSAPSPWASPTTFPSMVRFGFDRGAGSIGTAMSVTAIGSILGGIYIAGVKPHPHRTLVIALTGFGATCSALGGAPGPARA